MLSKNEPDLFLLNALYHNSEIPIRVYHQGTDGNVCLFRLPDKAADDVFHTDDTLFRHAADIALRNDKPVLFTEGNNICYGVYAANQNTLYLWGPICRQKMSDAELVSYRHVHHVTAKDYQITVSTLAKLSNIISILCHAAFSASFDEDEISLESPDVPDHFGESPEMEHYITERTDRQLDQLERTEMKNVFGGSDFERRYTSAIANGDIKTLKKLMHTEKFDMSGMSILAKSNYKQTEYICVTNSVLASRAAVRGGANPRTVWNYSDLYLQKLEKCKSIEEIYRLTNEMTLGFAKLVQDAKSHPRGNIYVEKAKDYIALKLRSPFSITEMANSFHIGRTYLSRLFKEQEGVTIQNYILKERLSHAANMLRFTDYAIADVAEYFCFSSQSYFSRRFKMEYGLTPWEYRERNRYVEGFRRD